MSGNSADKKSWSSKEHEVYDDLVEEFHDEEIKSEEVKNKVLTHLSECNICATRLRMLRTMRDKFFARPQIKVGDSFLDKFNDKLLEEPEHQSKSKDIIEAKKINLLGWFVNATTVALLLMVPFGLLADPDLVTDFVEVVFHSELSSPIMENFAMANNPKVNDLFTAFSGY